MKNLRDDHDQPKKYTGLTKESIEYVIEELSNLEVEMRDAIASWKKEGKEGKRPFDILAFYPIWTKYVRTEKSGEVDLLGCHILQDVFYWYLYPGVYDEESSVGHKQRRFNGPAYSQTRKFYAKRFSVPIKRVQRSIANLERIGLIKKRIEPTYYTSQGKKLHNVMFLIPVPEKIKQIIRDMPEKMTGYEDFKEARRNRGAL